MILQKKNVQNGNVHEGNVRQKKMFRKWHVIERGKRLLSICLVMAMLLVMSSCSELEGTDQTASGTASAQKEGTTRETTSEETFGGFWDKKKESSPEHDTDIGFYSIGPDQISEDMTEQEIRAVKYFDNDYMFINSYETLQRYTSIFEDSLISCYVNVAKIISYDDDGFEILVYLVENSNETYDGSYMRDERIMVLRGATDEARVIVGDDLYVRGRVSGIVSTSVDGVSLTVPEIETVDGCILGSGFDYFYPTQYSYEDVKALASGIFGENIILKDASEEELIGSQPPYYICTLENQSNVKLSRYAFYDRFGDLSDIDHWEYSIQVGADGEHFFLLMQDYDRETLTLEYYDNSLNCLWSREFSNSSIAHCDVTKNNLYMCINNELYIINVETGEDTFEPQYVGDKSAIRKYENGILMVSSSESDTFMYTDLEGNVLWRTDTGEVLGNICSIQQVNDTFIISNRNYDNDYYDEYRNVMTGNIDSYYVIDSNSGELIHSADVVTDMFDNVS